MSYKALVGWSTGTNDLGGYNATSGTSIAIPNVATCNATSATSVTHGSGSKVFTLQQATLSFAAGGGDLVRITSVGGMNGPYNASTIWMEGTSSNYSANNLTVTINNNSVLGSGNNYTDWRINMVKTYTMTTPNLAYAAGDRIRMYHTGNTGNFVEGFVLNYNNTSNNLSMAIDVLGGSGTIAAWTGIQPFRYTKQAADKIKNTLVNDIGWSLVADLSAYYNWQNCSYYGPRYILKTNGESGGNPDGYMALCWGRQGNAVIGAYTAIGEATGPGDKNGIAFKGYMYWNTTNQLGYGELAHNTANNVCLAPHVWTYSNTTTVTQDNAWIESPCNLWLYGDKDGFMCVTKAGAPTPYYSSAGAFYLKPFFNKSAWLTAPGPSNTQANYVGNLVTGVTLNVSDASSFIPGQTYMIAGAFDYAGNSASLPNNLTYGARDQITITAANTTNNTITVATLPKRYIGNNTSPSSTVIGQTPNPFSVMGFINNNSVLFCQSFWNMGTITNGNYIGNNTIVNNGVPIAWTYSSNDTYNFGFTTLTDAMPPSNNATNRYESGFGLYPLAWMDPTTAGNAVYYSPLGYTDLTLITSDFGVASEDTFELTRRDSGATTSNKTTSDSVIEDTTKSWGANAHANKFAIITSGGGAGQIKKIQSNTGNALTFTNNLSSSVATGSTYSICDEAYRAFLIRNAGNHSYTGLQHGNATYLSAICLKEDGLI